MYFLYILRCADDTLYTGITNDIENRMKTHKEGKGSKYLRGRMPFIIVHIEEFPDRSTASKRESEVKSLSKFEKLKLISI